MKKFFTFMIVAMTAILISSCEEIDTISADMRYQQGYSPVIYSATFGTGNEQAKALHDAALKGISDLQQKYDRQWIVPVSGSTIDEACAEADIQALADYDAAVAELKSWQEAFIAQRDAEDHGMGSFTISYSFVVKRDKVLKESEPIVFEYPAPAAE